MKNKKGFTLIELLAVIVVLAIIALIATPIVMNTIKNAKKGAAERTADNYIKQVETAVATERLNGNILEDGEYQITSDGNLCRDKSASCSDENKIYVEMSGTKPISGIVKIENGEISKSGTSMIIGDYNVIYSNNKYTATKLETYKITYNLTNVSGNNAASITSVETKSLIFTANTGYQLPESVTVTGATSVWDKKTGTLILSKVTGDVTVTINGVKENIVYTWTDWSIESIKKGDLMNDSTKYTTDPTTLEYSFYLKHILDDDNKVTQSYACLIFNNEEICLRGGNRENDYNYNSTKLKSLEDKGFDCLTNDVNLICSNGSIRLFAGLSGGCSVQESDGLCSVEADGASYCAES